MRKLLIFFFILFGNVLIAQVNATPKFDVSFPNASTTLGINISVGVLIYEVDTKQLFVCITPIVSSSTLTASKSSLRDLGDYSQLTSPPTSFLNSTPATNSSFTGNAVSLVANLNVGIGDVGFVNSSGKFVLCKADAIANCPYCFSMCGQASCTSGGSGYFVVNGIVRYDSWSWTVGGLIYVSITGTTGNTLTQTAPSATNNVIMPIGIALSASTIYFFGNMNSLEHL
jgi:hypothetical protein